MESRDAGPTTHGLQLSTSSISSADMPSPTTPTFSLRGHARFPSSTSSLASSPIMRESTDGFGSQKRPLTDVKEEPHEREEDYEMVDGDEGARGRVGGIFMNTLNTNIMYEDDEGFPSPTDYDLADDAQMDIDFGLSQSLKRQRAGDSSLTGLASRFGTRLPSLSRKWRQRRIGNSPATDDYSPEPKISRASSTRASSLAGSLIEPSDAQDAQLPPTPARSIFNGDLENSHIAPIDIHKANSPQDGDDDDVEAKASTPLLPPMMAQIASHVKEVPFQSPLQSPTIAPSPTSPAITDQESPFSVHHNTNLNMHGLPSPPLSTKPSISSFHHQRALSQPPPSSEIPPMLITDHEDEWSNTLGHANFTIHPEPYRPDTFDLVACKRLRSDWDLARCNYMKHLMRTGEHYGATSKIFRLTEEKWSSIDAVWKRNSEECISRTADNGFETELSMSHISTAEPTPLMKLPSLNGPRSEGKFPKLGDEDIVGPMEQVASQVQQRRQSRKAGFFRFLHGVLPSTTGLFGRTVRSRSSSP